MNNYGVWVPGQIFPTPKPKEKDSLKISELTAILLEIAEEHGDLSVFIFNDEYGEDASIERDEIKVLRAATQGLSKLPDRVSLGFGWDDEEEL